MNHSFFFIIFIFRGPCVSYREILNTTLKKSFIIIIIIIIIIIYLYARYADTHVHT